MATDRATAGTADSGRVEAFSDGAFAIAITLLILEINVPAAHSGSELWHELGEQWPSYCAYVVSFLVIGVMWVNHHTVFTYIARVDRTLVFLNLLLLLVVAALPFPTALVAENLREPEASNVATAVYGAVMVAHAVTFALLWYHVAPTGPGGACAPPSTAGRAVVQCPQVAERRSRPGRVRGIPLPHPLPHRFAESPCQMVKKC
ncbi:TMEM175 family protein [Kitasatospora aburaviensis]|uniref:TMEM175 family protein n=1 Tax=Kitasatospora aburaviensis TaxID=67265 RepID=A0ABW1EZE3_9ACTN